MAFSANISADSKTRLSLLYNMAPRAMKDLKKQHRCKTAFFATISLLAYTYQPNVHKEGLKLSQLM